MKETIIDILFFILSQKKSKYKMIILCFVLFFCSCNNKTEKDRMDIVIEKLTERYPKLKKGDSDYYRLVRSVAYDNNNFEIQLRTEPDSIADRQSILVFVNSKREYCAIPFFSNTYTDYWEFPNEESLKNLKKVKGTFSKELRNALLFLKHDKKVELFDVAEEMRHSLLYCSDLMEKDSLIMKEPIAHFGKYLEGNEQEENVRERLRKNYIDIMRNKRTYLLYQKNAVVAYLDPKNLRIYQFIYNKDSTFSIKSYRQDQKLNMTYL
ncbi:hypothetical protein [Flavobacterium sp. KACC 22761]|uniref:hypothetical protein n=1 Tax=Flavobacterium sp. KACC 22761 TaxID=3092665 RepID=UPI002A74FF16|nr:hypothetical protein [Flavobacterium sp. KACC 22761]WPO77293.1 hypothetical protein SCB73_13565 [Flavobacterium sp. KACC 22761]